MKRYRRTDEQFRAAIADSTSIRQVALKLGMNPQGGGTYKCIHDFIRCQGVDTSHFTGQLWSKGKQVTLKRPTEDYLNNHQPIQSHKLRLRLLREKILEPKCSSCNLTEWQGKSIPLELDHVDGNHYDNSLSNLRLLCPNCHALTPTHAGKNKGKGKYQVK